MALSAHVGIASRPTNRSRQATFAPNGKHPRQQSVVSSGCALGYNPGQHTRMAREREQAGAARRAQLQD